MCPNWNKGAEQKKKPEAQNGKKRVNEKEKETREFENEDRKVRKIKLYIYERERDV